MKNKNNSVNCCPEGEINKDSPIEDKFYIAIRLLKDARKTIEYYSTVFGDGTPEGKSLTELAIIRFLKDTNEEFNEKCVCKTKLINS